MAAPTRSAEKLCAAAAVLPPDTERANGNWNPQQKETARPKPYNTPAGTACRADGQDQGKHHQQQAEQQVPGHQRPTPVAGKPPARPGTGQQSGQKHGHQHPDLKINITIKRLEGKDGHHFGTDIDAAGGQQHPLGTGDPDSRPAPLRSIPWKTSAATSRGAQTINERQPHQPWGQIQILPDAGIHGVVELTDAPIGQVAGKIAADMAGLDPFFSRSTGMSVRTGRSRQMNNSRCPGMSTT
jgi:hypothetical protein